MIFENAKSINVQKSSLHYKNLIILFLIVLLLGCISFYYYHDIKVYFPSYTHAWAQADRYALSLQFIENGFDFFHPATFNLEPQFAPEFPLQVREGITRVDFPIHEYIVAIIMSVVGSNSALIFRLYILFYSILGILFLFLLAKKLTSSPLKATLVVIFAFTSPVFVFYQFGFLPTIPSLANAIIGLYFYFRFVLEQRRQHFLIAILFFTVSALARTPFVIILFAVFIYHFISHGLQRKLKSNDLLPFIISFCIIAGYYFYNFYLGKKYGSMFLNHLLPVHNLQEFKQILKAIYKNWKKQYFSYFHYLSLFLSLMFLIFYFFKHRNLKQESKPLLALLILIICGYGLFSLAMFQQFPDHDYYFLDTFYLPVILIFILGLIYVPLNKKFNNFIFILFGLAFFVTSAKYAKASLEKRTTSFEWDNTELSRIDYAGADRFLDSLQIPSSAKILILEAYSNNIPLILMNRKGYTILSSHAEVVRNALQLDYDYMVVQDRFLLSDVIKDFPQVNNYLVRNVGNGRISIYEKIKGRQPQPWIEFLGIPQQNILFRSPILYLNANEKVNNWENNSAISSGQFVSPPTSGILKPGIEFSATFSARANGVAGHKKMKALISGFFRLEESSGDAQMAFSIDRNEKNFFWSSSGLKNHISKTGEWFNVPITFSFPEETKAGDIVKIFIYNPQGATLYYDDLQVIFYKER